MCIAGAAAFGSDARSCPLDRPPHRDAFAAHWTRILGDETIAKSVHQQPVEKVIRALTARIRALDESPLQPGGLTQQSRRISGICVRTGSFFLTNLVALSPAKHFFGGLPGIRSTLPVVHLGVSRK